MKFTLHAILTLILYFLLLPLQADFTRVGVAANFSAPMKSIAQAFEQDTGHRVQLVFGSSGKLYAQIINGAPFEVFLSADAGKPARLEKDGQAVAGSRFTYALGSLVLWSATPGYIDNSSARLEHGDFRHIAVANHRLAPYGLAAREVMEKIDVWQKLKSKLVTGENIAQTYQFVSSGNAQLGFIALSQAIREGKIEQGSAWIVPQDLHQPIRQDAVLLANGKNNPAATAFIHYLKSDKAASLIREYGYRI